MSPNDIVVKKENEGDVINMFDDYYSSDESSIELSKSSNRKSNRKHNRKHPPPPTPTPVPALQQPPVSNPSAATTLKDDMFEVFTNPDKKRVIEESDDSFAADEPFEQQPNKSDFYQPHYEQHPATNHYSDDDEDYPADGFNSIDEEKQDYLYKFYRLQSKGVPIQKKFNINSNISEMRSEYNRIKRDAEVNSSIRFSRRMLMACVTAMEFMNKRYDPFDIKLDGWSESVMQNVDDYDNVFERLHDKYASKVAMAPEIELMLSLAGSAFMFHLTNSMFNSMPNLKDIAKQNPDILKNMMQSMSAATTNNNNNHAPPSQPPPSRPKNPVEESEMGGGFREMKGPMFDMSSLMGMIQPSIMEQPKPITNLRPIGNEIFEKGPPFQQPVVLNNDSPSEISSEEDGSIIRSIKPQTKLVSFSETTSANSSKRRGRNKIQSTSENTITL